MSGSAASGSAASGSAASGSAASMMQRLLNGRMLWIFWGLAMAAVATRVPEWRSSPSPGQITAASVGAVVAVFLAAPQRSRPIHQSNRWAVRLLMYRNTLLAAGIPLFVASNRPTLLEAWLDAVLLAGYLVLLDAATMPAKVSRRLMSPLFLALLLALVSGSAGILALHGSSAAGRRILAAVCGLALVAAAVAAAFTRADTRFTRADARRVGSRGPATPENEVPR